MKLSLIPVIAGSMAFAAVACGSTSSGDGAEEIVDRAVDEIRGGAVERASETVGIVDLERDYCTGTLIAQDVVLTAGHCVQHSEPVAFYLGGPGRAGGYHEQSAATDTMTRHAIIGSRVYPGVSTLRCPAEVPDIALLRLAAPVPGVQPDTLDFRAPAIGETCSAMGFGGHVDDAGIARFYERRVAQERVVSVAGAVLGLEAVSGNTEKGDSGGPLYCRGRIVGVNSCGNSPDYFARLDLAEDWIRAKLHEDWPVRPTSAPFASLEAAGNYVCGIKTDKTLQCWGRTGNGNGPWKAPEGGHYSAVSGVTDYTCAIRDEDGSLTCWGWDQHGQPMPPPSGAFTSISMGSGYSCGVRTDGTVACWGGWSKLSASVIPAARPPAGQFTQVSAGGKFTCGIRPSGALECWGEDHPCGHANGKPDCGWKVNRRPTDPPPGTFKAISVGGMHACAIRVDGTLACWGSDWGGRATPPAGTFTALSSRGSHNCAVRTDGTLSCWGESYSYQPRDFLRAPAGSFREVTVSNLFSCAERTDGTFTCWGNPSQQSRVDECVALGACTP